MYLSNDWSRRIIMETAKKNIYVPSAELEAWWQGWIITGCPVAWEEMNNMIYKICSGIATHFNPKDAEEHEEHAHDAFSQTIEKIKKGKLKFTPGKAPVFNLITTTAFRILYSKMNRLKKQREHHKKYAYQFVQKNDPDSLKLVEYPYLEKPKDDHKSKSKINNRQVASTVGAH